MGTPASRGDILAAISPGMTSPGVRSLEKILGLSYCGLIEDTARPGVDISGVVSCVCYTRRFMNMFHIKMEGNGE